MPGELVVVKGEHRGDFLVISSKVITIGRSESDDLSLAEDSKVSAHHAQITPMGSERYLLEDLGSTNGTLINGEEIEQVPLRPGDLIKIGRSLIVFRNAGSAVRLEDIELMGGGSSGSIARRTDEKRPPGSSSVALPRPSPAEGADAKTYEDLVLAAGDVALESSLLRIMSTLVEGLPSGRAMVFLRHPVGGGLGCAARACSAESDRHGPVDPALLEAANGGELATGDGRAAVPIMILGATAGVLYVDGCSTPQSRLGLLSAASVLVGLAVGLERSRQLASSATEIVALASAQVAKRGFELRKQLVETERLFAPAAIRRGLEFKLDVPEGLLANADPILFGRGLDKLLGYVLSDARGTVTLSARKVPSGVQVLVSCVSSTPSAARSKLLDPLGVTADLRRAGIGFGDGVLAVARVFFLRAGVRLSTLEPSADMVFCLDLERSDVGTERSTG